MLTARPAATPRDPYAPSPSRQALRLPVLTLAGARVDRIPTTMASTFVARLPDSAWTGDINLAVGAVTDSGELVGVALLSPPQKKSAKALVAVTPARRRLGVGADLLLVLVDGAARRGLRGIACALETDAAPAQRLCRALGLRPRIVRSHQDADVIQILIRPRPRPPGKRGERRRGLPSAIPPAGLVLAAALTQFVQCEAAHRAEWHGA